MASIAAAQGSSQSNQSSSNASGGSSQGNPPGITGGAAPPIQATLFAYQALAGAAARIATKIYSRLEDRSGAAPRIAILTQQDALSLVLWRNVMGQLSLIQTRVAKRDVLTSSVPIPNYSRPVSPAPSTPAPRPLAANAAAPAAAAAPGVLGQVQALAQILQTLSGAFATTQTVTAYAGTLNDTPLVNLVAGALDSAGVQVFVPSVYLPDLVAVPDLAQTLLGKALDSLETSRAVVLADYANYATAVSIARAVLNIGKTGGMTEQDVTTAQGVINDSIAYNAVGVALLSISSTIDSFEASLLGQISAPPTSQGGGTQAPGSSPSAPSGGTPPVSGGPPAGSAPPPSGQLGQQGNMSQSTANASNTLQTILAGDLLAHRIWNYASALDPADLDRVHILTLHALESGGIQLVKSHTVALVVSWNSIFFSGGSVATFAMFRTDGRVECSGYAYGYHGYVKDKDVDRDLRSPQFAKLEAYCPPAGVLTPGAGSIGPPPIQP